MNKRVGYIILGLVILLLLPIVWWAVTLFTQQGTVAVSVITIPSDATVKVNTEEYSSQKTIRLAPGTYTIIVSKEGFEETSQTLTVREDGTNGIVATLLPVSAEAQKWAQAHQDDYLEAEGKAGEIANQQGAEFTKMYPITAKLPIQKATYVIGYKRVSDNSSKGIIVTINAAEGYREAALQEIRDMSFDPSDYKIEFSNYRNPFNE